jgi:predicted nuclease of predicted toxin-antitoxin system
MNILFDQHLSPKLVRMLADLFPNSAHVIAFGMDKADDWAIWNHAAVNGLTIATKDDDFQQRSLVQGHPPKVILVGIGNCSTAQAEHLFRSYQKELSDFENDPTQSLIELL